jgi:hypothetical protein
LIERASLAKLLELADSGVRRVDVPLSTRRQISQGVPMRFVILTTLAVASFAVPAVAKDKKPADPNRKVCRSEQVTGSIFGRSVCHTVAEWRAIDDANRRDARNVDDKKTQGAVNL